MKLNRMAVAVIAGGLLCATAAPLPQTHNSASTVTADRDTTQKIRKAVMGDKSLSTYAHNVKILVHDGKVTLRGPVRSEEEKRAVADMASSVAGADNVINELTIQPAK